MSTSSSNPQPALLLPSACTPRSGARPCAGAQQAHAAARSHALKHPPFTVMHACIHLNWCAHAHARTHAHTRTHAHSRACVRACSIGCKRARAAQHGQPAEGQGGRPGAAPVVPRCPPAQAWYGGLASTQDRIRPCDPAGEHRRWVVCWWVGAQCRQCPGQYLSARHAPACILDLPRKKLTSSFLRNAPYTISGSCSSSSNSCADSSSFINAFVVIIMIIYTSCINQASIHTKHAGAAAAAAYASITGPPNEYVQALYEASVALEHEGAGDVDPEVFNQLLHLPSPSSTTNRGKVKPGKACLVDPGNGSHIHLLGTAKGTSIRVPAHSSRQADDPGHKICSRVRGALSRAPAHSSCQAYDPGHNPLTRTG